ncbi:MAG: tetratricopeptide repeat protein [Planctomycetota bacterium]
MERRFYESRNLRRAALLALAAALSGCGDAPEAPAPPPDARQVDAAIRATEAYLAADKPSEATFVSEKLAAEAPGLMRAHELHGRALIALAMRGDLPPGDRAAVIARAADAYARACAIDPANAALRHAAGVVCDTADRHGEAVGHYEAARAADPRNPQYALYLGLARARDGRPDQARELLEEAERAMPESPDPKAALADLAMRRGDAEGARRKIAEARSLAPASFELRLADARMRRLAGDAQGALELLLALDPPIRREPGFAEEIAAAHEALGDARAAAAALDDSASAAPNDWKRSLRAASAWMRAGDPVRATICADAAGVAGAPASEVSAALSGASGPRRGESPSP